MNGDRDAMGVVDVDPESKSYGTMVAGGHPTRETNCTLGGMLQFLLCPYSPHPHMERRYLVVPGLRSSRIHILDTKADPKNPK